MLRFFVISIFAAGCAGSLTSEPVTPSPRTPSVSVVEVAVSPVGDFSNRVDLGLGRSVSQDLSALGALGSEDFSMSLHPRPEGRLAETMRAVTAKIYGTE